MTNKEWSLFEKALQRDIKYATKYQRQIEKYKSKYPNAIKRKTETWLELVHLNNLYADVIRGWNTFCKNYWHFETEESKDGGLHIFNASEQSIMEDLQDLEDVLTSCLQKQNEYIDSCPRLQVSY